MIRIGFTLRIWHSKAVVLRIMFLKGGYSTLLRFLSPQDQCTSYSPAKHCESMDFKTSLSQPITCGVTEKSYTREPMILG